MSEENFFVTMMKKGWVDNTFIEEAEKNATTLSKRGFKKTQLRKFYGKVIQLQQSISPDDAKAFGATAGAETMLLEPLRLLRPKLAYDVGRGIRGAGEFRNIVDPAVEHITGMQDPQQAYEYFKLFVKGMEAFVAYFTLEEKKREEERNESHSRRRRS